MESSCFFPESRVPAVNVASVPHRSPLRYPGGKTWLIPHIREWLRHTPSEVLIEPFAGGAIVSLTGVMEGLVSQAVMVEIDRDVAAFWHSALGKRVSLADRVMQFEPTRENLERIQRETSGSVEDRGFRTLVLNRTRRGGILAPGASFVRNGENGKGLVSRWYPDTLAARLNAIRKHASRIIFMESDAMKLLPALFRMWGDKSAVFVDPPYSAEGNKRAGSRLYLHSNVDHAALFAVLAEHRANFLMTYDAAPEIVRLVREYNFEAVSVLMKNTHHNHKHELVITPRPLFS